MGEDVLPLSLESSEMLAAEYRRMAAVEADMWWYTTLHASVLATIQARFGEDRGIRILDAGCGTGGLLRYLRGQGYASLVGLDISEHALAFSREQGFEVLKGSIADAAALQQLGPVDVLLSMDVICSLPDEAARVAFFELAWRSLKPGGLLLVQTPAFNCLRGIHDLAVGVNARYTRGDMRRLLRKAGIERARLRYRLLLLTPAVFVLRALQRLRLKRGGAVAIESDVSMPSAPLNGLLAFIQRMEDRWLPFRPFGTSLQIVVTKDMREA